MQEREKALSSEELQEQTRKVYSLFPFSFPIEGEDLLAYYKTIARRENSEASPIILQKFDDLISKSPTTPSFKETLRVLAKKVMREGRFDQNGNKVFEYNKTFAEILQLDTKKGIYSQSTAKNAEKKLRNFVLDDFLLEIESIEETGKNLRETEFWTSPFFNSFDGATNYLKQWRNEFKELYGESPCPPSMPEEMEDLIIRGPSNY